jgi:hypothetical protein
MLITDLPRVLTDAREEEHEIHGTIERARELGEGAG